MDNSPRNSAAQGKTKNGSVDSKAVDVKHLQSAKDAVSVGEVGYCCIDTHIRPIIAALEVLTAVDETVDLKKRMSLLHELAVHGRHTVDDMANTMDVERETMQDKLDALQGASA